MTTDAVPDFEFSMMQLADSFFPTGMFSMSSGLEAILYETGRPDAAPLRDRMPQLLETYVTNQLGPVDAVLLSHAHDRAAQNDLGGIVEVDQLAHAMRTVKEARQASARSGSQLLRAVAALQPPAAILTDYIDAVRRGDATGSFPVALGVASQTIGIPKEPACVMFLYSAAVSIVGSALRLGLLDHLEGQRLIHHLATTVRETGRRSAGTPLAGLWQFDPEIQLFQIHHERLRSKMFLT